MKTVIKPWGTYTVLYDNNDTLVKRIVVNSGQRISLQKHMKRVELWNITSGIGIVHNDGIEENVNQGSVCVILKEHIHRIENTGLEELCFIETQYGVCEEEDVIRIKDDYGRDSFHHKN